MSRIIHSGWAIALVLLAPLASTTRGDAASQHLVVPLVIVVDGAGGYEESSKVFRQMVEEDQLPLDLRSFPWTHGYGRVAADQMDAAYLCRASNRLAELLTCYRQECPQRPIYLVGHSAGCGLALNAAGLLPTDTLERILLLAPAVSAQYDLRAALASSRLGIDVFISHRDRACLGIGTLIAGTTDRRFTRKPGGRVGFKPILTCPEDAALYAKLRQHPWNRSLACLGHDGGHYGSYQPPFMRLFVLPLLLPY